MECVFDRDGRFSSVIPVPSEQRMFEIFIKMDESSCVPGKILNEQSTMYCVPSMPISFSVDIVLKVMGSSWADFRLSIFHVHA
jgi:hypothetical protein